MTDTEEISHAALPDTPWPANHDGPVFFIIAGNDEFDHRLISAWSDVSKPVDHACPAEHSLLTYTDDDSFEHHGMNDLHSLPDETLIVPVTIRWPDGTGSLTAASRLLSPLRGGRKAQIIKRKQKLLAQDSKAYQLIAGEPASLSALKSRFEQKSGAAPESHAFADFVGRQAVLTLDRETRKISDKALKLPRFVVPAIMTRRDFIAELEQLATQQQRSLEDIRNEAESCLKEIAPAPSRLFVKAMEKFAKYICSLGYDTDVVFDKEKAAEIRNLIRTRPTALLWTHKTHVDGIALVHFSREQNYPLMHTIGGINMAIAGVGTLAKKSGAVFIRRSFQDDEIYKACFRHYISYVLEKRFPLAWSLEGTRSRIGKLMPPRYGVLKYVTEAAHHNGVQDLTLIPVSIYYDLIPEIDSYASEQSGAIKRKESLAWFLGYISGLRKPLGRIFMSFGTPIELGSTSSDQSDGNADRFSLEKLAFQAAVNINEVTPLTASGLLSFIMLSAAPQALTEREIGNALDSLRNWANDRQIPMTADLENSDTEKIRKIGRAMIEVGVLKEYETGLEPMYGITAGQEFTVSYYRNTIVHHFVLPSIIELSLARAMEASAGYSAAVFWEETLLLRDLFKFEFFYPDKEEFENRITTELNKAAPHWEQPLDAGRAGVEDLLENLDILFAHGSLKPYIEAYNIVADAILTLQPTDKRDEKSIVATCLRLGKQAVLRRRISGEESIAKLFYANGYKLASSRELLSGDDENVSSARVTFARELRALQQRMTLLEAIAARRRAVSDLGITGNDEPAARAQAAQ